MNEPISPRLLTALMAAPEDRRQIALRILEGNSLTQSDRLPLLVTINEAADIWGTHRSTVWRAVRSGRLQKVELFPGCFRLRRADVIAVAGGAL